MSWDGNIARLGRLADRIADLGRVPSRVASKVSREIATDVDTQFSRGQDPYGSAWKPLAEATIEKGRHHPPLTDTREMRESVLVRPMRPAGVSITVGVPYAAPHQTGWEGRQGKGPARPILPDRSALPDAWALTIEEEIEKEFRKAVRP